jgi:hypothetical protein
MRSHLPHKRDANHDEIAQAFRSLGCSVFDASAVGDGFPDLVVGVMRLNLLVEVKDAKGDLTEDQVKFMGDWRGTVVIVRNVDDVAYAVREARAMAVAVNNKARGRL